MPHVVWFADCSRQRLHEVGGKCANLGELVQAGIPVPPGFAVSTKAFHYFLTATGIGPQIDRLLADCPTDDLPKLESVAADIHELVRQAPVPASLQRAIQDSYQRLAAQCGAADVPVAVRSSATAEDAPDTSFAGLHETYLWVRGDDVLRTTAACWASLYTPRALSYRKRTGIGTADMLLSVGVQRMVEPRAAGVMFTLDPVNGDRSQIVIEASWGLGESVVKGEVTPDRFWVDKVTLEMREQVISAKALEYVPEPGGGVSVRDVPADRQTQPCLTPDEAIALARVGKRIEKYYGRPQDIEWAIDRRLPFPESLYIVQARAETAWSKKPQQVVQAPQKESLGYVVDFLLRNVR